MTTPHPSPYLYVFLDEGGDLNFSPTGTKFYTLTTVTTTRPFAWDGPMMSLKYQFIEQGLNLECFHAAEDRQAVRDKVFEVIVSSLSEIRVDALVIEKRKTGPALQIEERFYPQMVGYLLRYVLESRTLPDYEEVIVMTDNIPIKRKREAVEKGIKQTLSAMLPAGTKYRVLHHASKSCVSLQVADYCNWAIFRKWERSNLRSYDLIKSALKSEFDIFRSGTKNYY